MLENSQLDYLLWSDWLSNNNKITKAKTLYIIINDLP